MKNKVPGLVLESHLSLWNKTDKNLTGFLNIYLEIKLIGQKKP
jgi:hypothetical protein